MDNDNPFHTSVANIRTGAPKTESFIRSCLTETPAPKNIRERNLAQLLLAERLRGQLNGELDIVSCVEAVAPLYAAKFPH